MLGDFDREWFETESVSVTTTSLIFFFLYTFMVMVLLLNMSNPRSFSSSTTTFSTSTFTITTCDLWKKIFKYYGAELIETDAGDFDGAIELRDNLCSEKGWFNCDQFHNKLNIRAHYETTGPEIFESISDKFVPDAFILGKNFINVLLLDVPFLL